MSNYIQDLTQHIQLQERKKAIFNKTFFIAFVGPLVSTIILFSLAVSGVSHPASWVNWLMLIIFVPLITASLVIGQKKELVGAYGETILILIPTFVWLLGGHDQAIKYLMIITFAVMAFGVVTYAIGLTRRNKVDPKGQKVTQILLRLGFVGASVAATVVISIVLLNWADFSMHLAPTSVSHEDGKEIIEKDYTATAWIMFIALVTVFDAMLLVVLGLVSNYERAKRKKLAQVVKKQEYHNFINKTVIIDTRKNRRQWKHFWKRK